MPFIFSHTLQYEMIQQDQYLKYKMTNIPYTQQLKALENMYQHLRRADSPQDKVNIIAELRTMAHHLDPLLQTSPDRSTSKHRKHVQEILQRCLKVEQELSHSINSTDHEQKHHQSSLDFAIHCTARKSLGSNVLEPNPEEVEELVQRMEKNLNLIKDLKEIVRVNGNDLENIERDIDVALGHAEIASDQIQEAAQLAHKAFLMKFRANLYGWLTLIGSFFGGVKGAIVGLFVGRTIF